MACPCTENESEAHCRCKMQNSEALLRHAGVRNVALERALETVRADVSAEVNGLPVAIEGQISSLSLGTIAYRTMEYARKVRAS